MTRLVLIILGSFIAIGSVHSCKRVQSDVMYIKACLLEEYPSMECDFVVSVLKKICLIGLYVKEVNFDIDNFCKYNVQILFDRLMLCNNTSMDFLTKSTNCIMFCKDGNYKLMINPICSTLYSA